MKAGLDVEDAAAGGDVGDDTNAGDADAARVSAVASEAARVAKVKLAKENEATTAFKEKEDDLRASVIAVEEPYHQGVNLDNCARCHNGNQVVLNDDITPLRFARAFLTAGKMVISAPDQVPEKLKEGADSYKILGKSWCFCRSFVKEGARTF